MYWHGLYLSTSNSILAVDINNQNNLTNHANVIFDAYFNDSGGNATHSIVADVNPEYPWLHINIGVTDGTLINPTIQVLALDGTTNANYALPFSNIRNNVQLVDPTNNKVVFSNISSTASSQSIFKYDLQISTELGGSIDVSKLNEDSKILFTAVYTDSAGNTTNISKEIYLNVGWTANLTMNLNQEVLRYVSHNESDGKYVLLQTTVTSKLDSDGKTNILPVKKSTIVIDVPTYQGIAPSKVEVEGVRTMNTNGKNAAYVEFDSSNWSYNSSTNQITITVNNPLSGNIATSRRGPDEFIISYTYPEAAYNLIDLSGVNIANKMSGTIELYSNTSTINVTESVNNNITLTGYVSGITGSIPKTILYINSLKKYSHPLVYHAQTYIYLGETGDVYSQRMEIEQTHFFAGTTSFPSYIDGTNYVIIKDFFIPVSEFNTYLGSSGTIKIYTDDYTLVDTISSSTSTTTKNGQTGYYVTIPTSTARGTEKFILQTTRPLVANYPLNVYFDREIQSDMPYTIAQLQTFTHLDESGNVYHSYPADTTNYIYKTSARSTLGFKNTATDATLDVETNVLKSTADVQTLVFDIILDNSNTETDLWKEPVFDVELPEYITNANIVSVTMYNMPDLTFTSSDASILNSGGKLHFVLRAHDTQKGLYSDGKTIFKVELEVEVNKYTPTTTEDIVLHYYNELANIYLHPSTWTLDNSITDCGISTSSIAFVAEPKLYCVSKISNYDSEGSVVSSDSENNTGKIGLDSTEATMNLIVQNNHTVPASNIHILGRIPYINNKYVLLGTDLGTTINTKLTSTISQVSNIDADKITVYYSSNLNAATNETFTFRITGTDVDEFTSIDVSITINAGETNGTLSDEDLEKLNALPRGTYEVTEVDTNGYTIQDVKAKDKTNCYSKVVDDKVSFTLGSDSDQKDVIKGKTYETAGILGVAAFKNEKVTSNWGIKKVSASNNDYMISGAVFKLAPTASGSSLPTYYGKSQDGGTVKWYRDPDCTTEISGTIQKGSYTLSEITAPTGYVRSTETWSIKIASKGALKSIQSGGQEIAGNKIKTEFVDGKEVVYYLYENEVVYDLPSTGHTGIFNILMSGILLMFVGILIIYKMKGKEVLKK